MKEIILKIVDEYWHKTRGGVTIIKLILDHNLKHNEIIEAVTELYNDGEIEIRTGINHFILYKKNAKIENKLKKRKI